MPSRSPGRKERGFGFRRVKVMITDHGAGQAWCRDTAGHEFQVTLRVRVGKGGYPQVGEEWFVTKEFLGRWVFYACIDANGPPVIRAPREGMDRGTEEIFDALIRLGIVKEEGADFKRSTD